MHSEDARDVLDRYNRAKQIRSQRDNQWRLNAAYCLPRDYERWASGDANGQITPSGVDNAARAQFAFDSSGVRAIPKYKAICKRLINPEGVRYHTIEADNATLMQIPAVRQYFTMLTEKVFSLRHTPRAKFGTGQGETYGSIGVYGNGVKTTLWRPPSMRGDKGGFAYRSWPMYNLYWLVDDLGNITDIFRRMWLTKRQFQAWLPDEALPTCFKNVLDSDITTKHEFVHVVSKRNSEYDPKALDARRHPWKSCYVCVTDVCFVEDEKGFVEQPYQISATDTVAGDPYGYSPAEIAFPALGTANAVKKTYLKQGHKAVDPTLLVRDDGAISGRIDARPGRYIYGGIDNQGRAAVAALQNGSNFQVAEQILADERNDINDSFLVTLFQILTETPEMTAAEVYERVAEKAALFAPTLAALQESDQGPQVERELAIMAEHGLMPPMPPELLEAGGEYKVTYVNPMAKALYAGEVAGFVRWVELLANAANLKQDPSILDHVDWDAAAPAIAFKMDVRPEWVATADKIKKIRGDRNAQTQQAQMVEAAPAAASVMSTMANKAA